MPGFSQHPNLTLYTQAFKWVLGLCIVVVLLTTGVLHAGGSQKEKALDWNGYTQAGKLALESKNYDKAELSFKKALVLASTQNKASLEVAMSLDNLAQLYQRQGRYLEADPMYRKAIELYQKRLGREHKLVGQAIKNLSALYDSRGQTLDVKALLLPVDTGMKGLPDTKVVNSSTYTEEDKAELAEATKMNDLGLLYKSKRDFTAAEPLYQKALAIYQRIMGADHVNVAITLDNMGRLASAKKEYTRAETLYSRALSIYKKSLGENHLTVASTLTSLGVLYGNQEQYAKSEALLQQALSIREKQLGPNHPDVLKSLTNLAIIYENQDKLAEAKPVYERALQAAKRLYPENHQVIQDIENILTEL